MTALPDPLAFDRVSDIENRCQSLGRPLVTEQFWGYEIAPSEIVIDLALLIRAAFIFFAACLAVAAVGIWFVPDMAFAGPALMGKSAISLGLAALALVLTSRIATGGRVVTQVDTKSGELREVSRTLFGNEIILATYGFDTIEAVNLHRLNDRCQITIEVAGVGLVPAGDGHIVCVSNLKAKLERDLGLAAATSAVIPDFAGPLVR